MSVLVNFGASFNAFPSCILTKSSTQHLDTSDEGRLYFWTIKSGNCMVCFRKADLRFLRRCGTSAMKRRCSSGKKDAALLH